MNIKEQIETGSDSAIYLHPEATVRALTIQASIAISMKRAADALEVIGGVLIESTGQHTDESLAELTFNAAMDAFQTIYRLPGGLVPSERVTGMLVDAWENLQEERTGDPEED